MISIQQLMLAILRYFHVNSVNSFYILLYILYIVFVNSFSSKSRSFLSEMPWSAGCHCKQHDTWFPNMTVSNAVLRCASPAELKFCKVNPKHADRKRKICINCRGLVQEESAMQVMQANCEYSQRFTLFYHLSNLFYIY